MRVEFDIFDFNDLKRWARIIFDYIKFLCSRPKYKVGQRIKIFTRPNSYVIEVIKNWKLIECGFYYELSDDENFIYSEKLLTFYEDGHK